MGLGIPSNEESTSFQSLLAEGFVEGFATGLVEAVRGDLLRLGRRKFGPAARRSRPASPP